MTGVAVDVGALRESAAFRRLTAGQLVSLVGRQITTVAVPYQVYVMTRSPVLVGLLGLAQVIPLVTVSLIGGGIADRVDRRRLLLVTQTLLGLGSLALLIGALNQPPVAFVFVVVALASCAAALDAPTRTAIVPNLVSAQRLPGALSINIAMFQTSLVAGPALGGLVIAHVGLAGAYLVDVASFAAALLAVWLLPSQPPHGSTREPALAALRRGFAFIRRRRVILGGYAMDLSAMIFGLPRALFPVLAATTFGTDAQGLGYLYAAPGAGAVLAALSSGWLSRSTRLGRVVVVTIALWGLAIIAFGFVTSLWVGLLLLAFAGAADAFSAVCRNTIMQTLTPDELRGRLTATYFMVVVGGPFIGDLEAGVVAGVSSPRASVVSGGVLCLVGLAAAALAFPEVWAFRGRATDIPSALTDDAVAGPPV
ncbi:MAG: MFS transporter [Candidatus Dormibacteraeota bacterium]|uniref:MFS transporter n=1 Tax=Candidatus Amunia macphersoniae TaxID=3127014 RepID=A0A934KL55_9BACT|nr:MFS transporter [Candidatus Dormibacteraeota bacterium]